MNRITNEGQGRGSGARGPRNYDQEDDGYIPMLSWSPNFTKNNFASWKEKITNLALRKFGHLGRLFEDGDYYEPPEIPRPAAGVVLDEYDRHALLQRSSSVRISLHP